MLYFIPWVVLLFLSILAIPIASMMDKRRLQAAYDSYDDSSGNGGGGFDGIDDEPLEPLDESGPVPEVEAVSEGFGEEGMIEVPEDGVEAFGTPEDAF